MNVYFCQSVLGGHSHESSGEVDLSFLLRPLMILRSPVQSPPLCEFRPSSSHLPSPPLFSSCCSHLHLLWVCFFVQHVCFRCHHRPRERSFTLFLHAVRVRLSPLGASFPFSSFTLSWRDFWRRTRSTHPQATTHNRDQDFSMDGFQTS